MKIHKKIFFIILSTVILVHFSSIKVYSWFKHYGGTDFDYGNWAEKTSDGGYIMCGSSKSYTNGGHDFAIYKLNSSGNKVWFKHYGGASDDQSYSIQQTSDGGYIVAGNTESYTHGIEDFAIYKLDCSGNKLWFKNYGGTGLDEARSIQQTSDGGYIVAGRTNSYSYGGYDMAIYKLNSSGNKVWFKHYGGNFGERAYSIRQTTDGGYIVAGYTESYTNGNADIAVYRLNSSGNKIWFKHYGGIDEDQGWSIQQTSDGGYIVAGVTESYTNGNEDFAIYKLNSSGNKTWFKHYGGANYDWGKSIQQTSDGGYIAAGNTQSFTHGNTDIAVYKLNSSGNKTWFKHYGGTGHDYSNSTRQTTDGGYMVGGQTISYTYGMYDFAIYKLDSAGNK